jgi:hypothetical protein
MMTFTVSATDVAGNESAVSTPYTVELVLSNQDDTSIPDVPVITAVYDDVGVKQGLVEKGGLTDDAQVKITGTANAGSLIIISHTVETTGGHYVDGSVYADASGNWTYQMGPEAFTSGQYGNRIITATATSPAGNVSDSSDPYTIDFVGSNQDAVNLSGQEYFEYLLQGGVGEWQNGDTIETDAVALTYHGAGGMLNYQIPNGLLFDPGGRQYFFLYGDSSHASLHIDLKQGVTDSVTISATPAGTTPTVTLYDATGHVIPAQYITMDSHDFNPAVSGDLYPMYHYTVSSGYTVASMDVSNVVYFGGLEWGTDGYGNPETHSALLMAQAPEDMLHADVTLATLSDTAHQTLVQQHTVDLHDNAQNTLTLSLNDVLNHAQENMFINDGHQQLAVAGDVGDVVELKVSDLSAHEWADAGHTTSGGITYEVYQHAGSDVELLVQQGVELHQTV